MNARSGQKSRVLNSSRTLLNQVMVWPLAAIAFAASIFYGGNLPIYWVVWASVSGIMGAIWFGWLAWNDEKPRITLSQYPLIALGFAVFAFYHVVQIVPLGGLAPALRAVTLSGAEFRISTISVDPGETLLALFRWLTFGVLFFLTLQVAGVSARAEKLLTLIFWAIVVHAFAGLAMRFQFGDTMFGIPKWTYLGSTTGGFVNRNSFATYLAFGCVLAVTRIVHMSLSRTQSATARHIFDFYTSHHGVTPSIIGLLIIMIALITTNSRMGLFSALAGMGFVALFLLLRKSGKTRRRRTWRMPLVMLGALFVVVAIYGADLYSRVENLYLNDDLSVRMELYRQISGMIADRPLSGFGGGAFNSAYPLYHQLPVSLEFVWDKTHSTYLAMWVEYGLLFGTVPMLLLGAIFVCLMIATFRSSQPDPLIISAAGVIVVGALHSLFDFSLEMEGVAIVFVMIIAAGFAKALLPRNRAGTQEG